MTGSSCAIDLLDKNNFQFCNKTFDVIRSIKTRLISDVNIQQLLYKYKFFHV